MVTESTSAAPTEAPDNTGMADENGAIAVTGQDKMPLPRFLPSDGFGVWLGGTGGSLVLSTYQSARLIFLYVDRAGTLQVLDRVVGTAMGLAIDQDKIWLGNREQVWKFANTGPAFVDERPFDAVYMPRKGYFTGPCDTHDILADIRLGNETVELAFVSTAYSCIAALDEQYNFRPLWKPNFISRLTPTDNCHLNGMGARDGAIAFATACGRFDTPTGWRGKTRTGGGFVLDVPSGEVIADGLSMPHSPRWHRDRLWLLNSAAGEFGYIDGHRFVAVADCPGFARGLTFMGDYAIIGLSQLRPNSFGDTMPLHTKLQSSQVKQRCGLLVIDLKTGRNVHWLTIAGPVTELYDVAFNPGIRQPYCPGFREPHLHKQRVQLPDGPLFQVQRDRVQKLSTKPPAPPVMENSRNSVSPNRQS